MLTLVLGGARSGKSRYAQSVCRTDEVAYIATATIAPGDDEMANRVAATPARPRGHLGHDRRPLRVLNAVRDTPQVATVCSNALRSGYRISSSTTLRETQRMARGLCSRPSPS